MKLKATVYNTAGTGYDVSNYFDTTDYTIESNIGGQLDNYNNAEFRLKKAIRGTALAAGVIPLQWKEVVIEDLDMPDKIFGGYITTAELIRLKGQTVLGYSCKAQDYQILLEKQITYNSYTDQWDGDIVKSILTQYFGNIFTLTGIENTIKMSYFATYNETVTEAIRRLCEINGVKFWIDYSKVAHYSASQIVEAAPFSFAESGTPSSTASVRTMQLQSYNEDLSALATWVRVVGGTESVTAKTDLIGYGELTPLTQYQLAYEPTNISSFYMGASASLNIPVLWTYVGSGNEKDIFLSANNSVYSNLFYVLGRNVTIGYLQIYSGKKIVLFQSADGTNREAFSKSEYHFERECYYTINYNADGTLDIKKDATTSPGAVYAFIQIVTPNNAFFDNYKAVWISDGYPVLINQDTGLISYANVAVGTNSGAFLPYYDAIHTITYDGIRNTKVDYSIPSVRDAYTPLYDGVNHLNFYHLVRDERLKDAVSASQRGRTTLVQRARPITTGKLTSWYARGLKPGQVLVIDSPTFGIASKAFAVNQVVVKALPSQDTVNYEVSFGDYNPGELDWLLKLNRRMNDSQDSVDTGIYSFYGNAIASVVVKRWDDGTVWEDGSVWG